MAGQNPFLLTVDVEPDWGLTGCRSVQETLPRFCRLLQQRGIRGTFFVVADLLDQCGDVILNSLTNHEVASHGLTHRQLHSLPATEIARELGESKSKLEKAFRRPIRGFRAPFLRTPPGWFEALGAAGYDYDSSRGAVAPSFRNRRPKDWRTTVHNGVTEIPVTALRTGWIPFSLTYLRLLAPLGERLISPDAPIIYFHLHELMPPSLGKMLPAPLRYVLPHNSGPAAWEILERLLDRFGPRMMTCSEWIDAAAKQQGQP